MAELNPKSLFKYNYGDFPMDELDETGTRLINEVQIITADCAKHSTRLSQGIPDTEEERAAALATKERLEELSVEVVALCRQSGS